MPEIGLRENFDLTTRGIYSKCDARLELVINGRELPNMAVLGTALEACHVLIQEAVTESYKAVPARINEAPASAATTPVA